MNTFKFDESMIEQGIRASIVNYYQALLIKDKDESKAKEGVCKLLSSIKSDYATSVPGSKEPTVERV
jgi:hypothetical protein